MNWRDRRIVRDIVNEQARALASGRRITERGEGGDRRGIPCDSTIGANSEGEFRYQAIVVTTDHQTGQQSRQNVTVWSDSPLSLDEIGRRAQETQMAERGVGGPPPPPPPGSLGVSVSTVVQSASRRC